MTVGVTAFQGAVEEHLVAVERALHHLGREGRAVPLRKTLGDVDALIVPGGESTTISALMQKTGMWREILDRAEELPVMGTCAGCILLATEVVDDQVPTLGLMDMAVERNAFGRQNQSFQCMLEVAGFSDPVPGIFIRAPLIRRVGRDCQVLAAMDQGMVMARCRNKLALVFHPELTEDVRIHQYFLNMVED
ncbi:MAG TPA: pyridoxal 5'-phosphate synthase glutaminase subunit PdxT [Thermoplasmatales archaeon]|nr:pyridoxal 5'-phosphate synthase glutaminase subunit PdxT [Candidatus Thermoplasmatota archaeon]MDD5777904.1 pyridoxal 5'-phosphate synthase glutaminase subunit PdxT [Candidatus Thermoplasmatota archaeon]HDS59987.1 pyridoxal 5'-phosphate synthase glutaminase subunit PdxT [Thermoplasmatales archaeon]